MKLLKEWLSKKLKEKHKPTYITLIVIYYIVYYAITLIIGGIIGFFFSEKFIHLQHSGFLGFSSFSYNNIDNFRTSYYQNSTVTDQNLKVASSWINEIGAETQIKIIPEGDIDIICYVEGENQNCEDYEIQSGLHQILYFNISIGLPSKEKYQLCFYTFEGSNNKNDYEGCVSIMILPNR